MKVLETSGYGLWASYIDIAGDLEHRTCGSGTGPIPKQNGIQPLDERWKDSNGYPDSSGIL